MKSEQRDATISRQIMNSPWPEAMSFLRRFSIEYLDVFLYTFHSIFRPSKSDEKVPKDPSVLF